MEQKHWLPSKPKKQKSSNIKKNLIISRSTIYLHPQKHKRYHSYYKPRKPIKKKNQDLKNYKSKQTFHLISLTPQALQTLPLFHPRTPISHPTSPTSQQQHKQVLPPSIAASTISHPIDTKISAKASTHSIYITSINL